jgi:hypothetical protein
VFATAIASVAAVSRATEPTLGPDVDDSATSVYAASIVSNRDRAVSLNAAVMGPATLSEPILGEIDWAESTTARARGRPEAFVLRVREAGTDPFLAGAIRPVR